MSEVCYILLGSNIDPRKHIKEAIVHLDQLFTVKAISSIYETEPIKRKEADKYLNAVVCIETSLDPISLKYDHLRKIEEKMGRIRTNDKYKPRVIDLDLIVWGSHIYTKPEQGLIIPDPEITRFAHVALPLADIATNWIHPVHGVPMRTISERFRKVDGIRVVEDYQIS